MENSQTSSSPMEDQPPKKTPTIEKSNYFRNQHSLLPSPSPSLSLSDVILLHNTFLTSLMFKGSPWDQSSIGGFFIRLPIPITKIRYMEIVSRPRHKSVAFCEVLHSHFLTRKTLTFYPFPASLAKKTGTHLWFFQFSFEILSCLGLAFVFYYDYGVWMSLCDLNDIER